MHERPHVNHDIPYNPEYYRHRYEVEGHHPKVRFWIWIIATTSMIAFVFYATSFMERCRTNFVFSSLTFKFSMVCFFISFILCAYILVKSNEYRRNRMRMVWLHLHFLSIAAIIFVIAFLILFTIAIYPAYKASSIVFTILAALLVSNLACLILYD